MTAPQRDPKARSDRVGIIGVGIIGVGIVGIVGIGIGIVGVVGIGIGIGIVGIGVVGVVDLVRDIRRLRYREGRHREWAWKRQIARMPLRMAEWSAWVLPAENRPRYRHEIEAELFELRDHSRRVQLIYAMRLLARSVALRRALQHSARMVPFQKQDW